MNRIDYFDSSVNGSLHNMGNQTETDMDVSCLVNLDKFYKCCGVTHQFGSVYRQEEFDNCSHKFDDFKNCIMAKTVSSEEKRKVSS